MMSGNLARAALALPAVAALVGLWALISAVSGLPEATLPGPLRTWNALLSSAESGQLWRLAGYTSSRMLVGWLLASLIGVALGLVIGSMPRLRRYIQPTLEFLRPLPASAIMPVAILFLGLSETSILATIAFGALWPVLLGTVHGIVTIDRRLLDVANALNLSQPKIMVSLALPNAATDIMTGLRISLAASLILAVVGEMLTSRQGLGLHILQASRLFNGADVYAGTIALGVIGLVSNLALRRLELRVLRWRDENRSIVRSTT